LHIVGTRLPSQGRMSTSTTCERRLRRQISWQRCVPGGPPASRSSCRRYASLRS
jgi:hypothetical protein